MLGIVGKKVNQTQKFLEDGTRIPVTQVNTGDNIVVSLKTLDKDRYAAVQIGFGIRKNFNKAQLGHGKKAGMEKPSRFLREIRVTEADSETLPEIGSIIKAEDVLKPGDIVDVSGNSKGKGYAGVVKRHHFKGGPRTHGQSDRERAPGSIGQTTTPGRVYKGKRMAGRMGDATATLKNLTVIDVSGNDVFIKGLLPGSLNSLVIIRKTGESKKFVPLWKEAVDEPVSEEVVSDEAPLETSSPETVSETVAEQTESAVPAEEPSIHPDTAIDSTETPEVLAEAPTDEQASSEENKQAENSGKPEDEKEKEENAS